MTRKLGLKIGTDGGSWSTIFTQTLNANDTGWATGTTRNVVQITGGAGGGGLVRVTFECHSSASLNVDNASIGISTMADASDTVNKGATTATPVELLFSGVSGFSLTAGQSITSDAVSLSGFTATKLLVVVLDYGATNGNIRYASGLGTLPAAGATVMGYVLSAANSYASSAESASSFNGWVACVNKIEVQ